MGMYHNVVSAHTLAPCHSGTDKGMMDVNLDVNLIPSL